MGWGKYSGENSFKNPFSYIFDELSTRPLVSDNFNLGGSPSYDQWFRGDTAFFGGLEYQVPKIKNVKFKIEYDPYNYFDFSANERVEASNTLRKKDSNINVGLSYSVNKFTTIDISYIKGNTLNLSFNFGITFNDQLSKKPKFNTNQNIKKNLSSSSNIFYEDLLFNLNKNKLLLQTSSLDKYGRLDITIASSEYRNAIRSASYAAYISKEVAYNKDIDLSLINVSHINAGIELNNITFVANHLTDDNNYPVELKIRNTKLDSGDPKGFLMDEFQPNVNFPVIFSSINPTLVTHIGNPEKFYFGGINLQHVSEIQFSRNLLLSSELNARLYDNFQNTISGSNSKMQHVRTDLIEYLKEDDLYITRMQMDYIWSPYKDIYTKISGGIFETMYGGIGGEILYKPFSKNFNIGFELFYVKQRDFNQRFNFKEYETLTGHINFGYKFAAGIESNLSYGRYLAKDHGYTFDLSRKTNSGFKAGIYFTKTNVSADLFGEGSFDKGFYFQIPLDLFSNEYNGNYSTFKLSPLTRDGGSKLVHDKDLKGLIYNSTYNELSNQWNGFLN